MQETDEGPESQNGHGLRARAGEKVREMGTAVKDRAGERVRDLGARAREKASERLDDERERIATRIDTAAENLKLHAEHGNRLQQEAERRMAGSMDAAAGYLHSHPSEEVARDVQGLFRRHPVRSALIALIAGYLLYRLLR